MKWFKHDANANTDAKLRRIRMKYGMEGYGLYWYCLELIASSVEKHNLTFELEHDAEIIAHDTGIHHERVQEMMIAMVNLGLFEESDGRITCLKMAARTDEYTQQLLKKSEQCPESLSRVSRESPESLPRMSEVLDKNRLDKNRTEDKYMAGKPARRPSGQANALPAGFDQFWAAYPRKANRAEAIKAWKAIKPDLSVVLADLSARVSTWTDPQFIPYPGTYLRQERWTDEIPAPRKPPKPDWLLGAI